MEYATLYQVRQYLSMPNETVKDNSLLESLVKSTCAAIDKYSRRFFDVKRETRLFDYPAKPLDIFGVYNVPPTSVYSIGTAIRTRRISLKVDEHLLSVLTLTNGDGTVIAPDDFLLYPANYYPKNKIKLKNSSDVAWNYPSSGDTDQVIDVDGLWGYHNWYNEAWVDSLDTVVDDPLAIGGTTLTVDNANGVASDGEMERFQTGNMIRFGSAELGEYAYVREVNTTSNELTIVRGYNGTTAEEQDQGTGIYLYRPMKNIVLATTRLVVWRYRQKDVDAFDTRYILGSGFAIVPSLLPSDVIPLIPSPRETIRIF